MKDFFLIIVRAKEQERGETGREREGRMGEAISHSIPFEHIQNSDRLFYNKVYSIYEHHQCCLCHKVSNLIMPLKLSLYFH